MFVVESIHEIARSSESVCVHTLGYVYRDMDFDRTSRATRYSTSIPRDATRFGSVNQFSPRKILLHSPYLRTGE